MTHFERGELRIKHDEGLAMLRRIARHMTGAELEGAPGLALADAYRALWCECKEAVAA